MSNTQKSLLETLDTGQGYLKAGMLGFQGSGKTMTAILLAIYTRKLFKLDGPIALVDTENATAYVAPIVQELTGKKLIGRRTRNFDELVALGKECQGAGVSVMVGDSMTHFWRSLCDSYLAGINQSRETYYKEKGWKFRPKTSLEFQDWGPVKKKWAEWTDLYLNSPMHIIICGRAGYEYDFEKDDESGKKELVKTGIKMKTEGEFGFEPSLLVEMEVDQIPNGDRPGKFSQVRTATVLKDRFAVIDGSVFTFPGNKANGKPDRKADLKAVADAFGPHLELLKPGAHSAVPTNVTPMQVDETGGDDFAKEKKTRQILCEEAQGLIVSLYPGQSAVEKKAKVEIVEQCFGTRSWTAVESMDSGKLRVALDALRKFVETKQPKAETPDDVPMP